MLKEPSVTSLPFPKRPQVPGMGVHEGTVSLRHCPVSRPALLSQVWDAGSRVSQPSAVPSTHSLCSIPVFPTSPQALGGQVMVASFQRQEADAEGQ